MHPEIEKLVQMALVDGQVTEKEREIILRKAEKLGIDVDEVEMFLEGKINLVKLETTVIEESSINITERKNNYKIKVFRSVTPVKLDNEKNLILEIEKKENQKRILQDNLINLKREFGFQLDSYKKNNAIEKENTIKLLENKQNDFNDFLNKFKKKYVLKTKDELEKNKKNNLKFILKDNLSNDCEFDFTKSDGRIKFVINNSEWKSLGNPFFSWVSFFLCVMLFSMFIFDGMENYYFLLISLIFLIILLFSKSQSILKNASDKDPLTINGRDILFKRLKDFFINNIESNFTQEIEELTKKNNEIDALKDNINFCNEVLINIQSNFENISKNILEEVSAIDDLIAEINKSISFERNLKEFPSQAIGSVYLYNNLNEKFDLFVDTQFNKIIRFLDHIENKEKNYRKLYVECTNNYINKPSSIPILEFKKEEKEINDCYKLLLVLINEVNGDLVKFNKVYNKLEDAGLFMTVPEKANQQYLSDISSKLDNVILGLKTLFQSLEEINQTLGDIEGNTSDISFYSNEISNQLWDISFKM